MQEVFKEYGTALIAFIGTVVVFSVIGELFWNAQTMPQCILNCLTGGI